MLQICMDMKLFLYGMIAAGIAGVWCLFRIDHFYNTAIRDLKRKDKPKGKWTSRLLEEAGKKRIVNAASFVRIRMEEGHFLGACPSRLYQSANIALSACILLFAVAAYGVFAYGYEPYVLLQHGLLSGTVIAGLLMLRVCMELADKEERILDGWCDYFENTPIQEKKEHAVRERARPVKFPITEQEKITRIEKGIREAAAADSRFSGVLTPEEEKLFREVIREYLN